MSYSSNKSQKDSLSLMQRLRHPVDSTIETLKTRKLIQEDRTCRICQHQKPIKFSFYCMKKEKFILPYAICVDFSESLVKKIILKEGETKS